MTTIPIASKITTLIMTTILITITITITSTIRITTTITHLVVNDNSLKSPALSCQSISTHDHGRPRKHVAGEYCRPPVRRLFAVLFGSVCFVSFRSVPFRFILFGIVFATFRNVSNHFVWVSNRFVWFRSVSSHCVSEHCVQVTLRLAMRRFDTFRFGSSRFVSFHFFAGDTIGVRCGAIRKHRKKTERSETREKATAESGQSFGGGEGKRIERHNQTDGPAHA